MTDLPPDDVHDEVAPDDDVLAETEGEIAARSVTPLETGHPAVDEVLRSLNALDDTPVDEHVAVFEQAHEELRRTLSGAGDDQN